MRFGQDKGIDWVLIVPPFILCALGLITISSISSFFLINQIIYLVLGVLFFLFFANTNFQVLQKYSLHIYLVSLGLLLIVLILGIESRGAIRWIEFFGIRIQFSEIFKPFLAIALSSFLAGKSAMTFKRFLTTLLLVSPVGFLIFVQPDLGNAVIYIGVVLTTLFAMGYSFLFFLAVILLLAIFSPLLWFLLRDYQKERLFTFMNPSSDPLGSSYNLIQSVIAVGSGMFLGKGFGEGTQSILKFLPERHTDFIFATFSEEFGFVGSLIILGCFSVFLYRIFILTTQTDSESYKIFYTATFFLFLIQFFVNTGMNLGILPIVGVTLPFVSYGGSSLISSFTFLGLLYSAKKECKARSALEIK